MNFLYDKLKAYSEEDFYPFHMPGHKGNPLFAEKLNMNLRMDITEIEGFDNLHHAQGIIQKAQERASRIYGTKKSYFCVNGSSGSLLSAISACTSLGGKILMARNCHKAVYHGAYLRNLDTCYVYPQFNSEYPSLAGEIRPEDVRTQLRQNPGIQAVVITSPTYDGMVSDIETIAEIVHEYEIPLIVDEAHGAHFPFHEIFPKSALELGADIVIHSIHKTLPSFTQTSLLHVNSERVDEERIGRFLGIYQTSSPSYLLMSSMDACLGLLEQEGVQLYEDYVDNLVRAREQLGKLKVIQLVEKKNLKIFDYDPSKIILMTKNAGMTGHDLYMRLIENYHLQLEMAAPDYVLALSTVGDTKEGFRRLTGAIGEINEAGYENCRSNGQ